MKPNLYLAGPLFTTEERYLNLMIADILSPMFDVYLPQRDGILLNNEIYAGKDVQVVKESIFAADCAAMDNSAIIFAILNGRTIDEGVAFELGYGFSRGKKCWAYKDDWRSLLKHGDNPMIEGAIERMFNNVDDIKEVIQSMHGG